MGHPARSFSESSGLCQPFSVTRVSTRRRDPADPSSWRLETFNISNPSNPTIQRLRKVLIHASSAVFRSGTVEAVFAWLPVAALQECPEVENGETYCRKLLTKVGFSTKSV